MTPLPIDAFLPEIIARVREARAVVLVAPPGAGKTTRVPPALLSAGLLDRAHPNLVMLQPRRVAARAAAARIAEERGWELGNQVGYHVRFERRISNHTRLRVLTEGILTRQLTDDPFLEGVGAVLLDEFHERSLHTDIAIALLREVRQTVREDLILVVMSATLEAEPVAKFLGDAPIVRAEGRAYPVEIRHRVEPQPHLPERVAAAVEAAIEGDADAGDVLVFLPGAEEIRRTQRRLEGLADRLDLLVLPLHGSLPAEEQMLALRPANRQKIILATIIAETSLTIDGVRTVIDAGLARVAGYDPRRGLDRLELRKISKASATQRTGRAGRTAPGRCIRLWPEREQWFLADFEEPEIRRVDLCGTVLQLHAWGQPDPRKFGWYEPPDEPTLAAAERLLAMLGAISGETGGQITPLGRQMLSLPVHPRLARLLIAAAGQGRLAEGVAIAALLSEKDIARTEPPAPGERRQTTIQGDSDLLIRLQWLDQAERERFGHSLRDRGIDPIAARQVAKTRDELLRVARRIERSGSASGFAGADAPSRGGVDSAKPQAEEDDALLKLPLCAYPDRVCRRRAGDAAAGAMVGGGGVRLAAESAVRQAEFFVALDARQDERSNTREAMVRVASAVKVEWLAEMFPDQVRREKAVTFDEARGRVVGVVRMWYRDLLLSEDPHAAVDPEQAGVALAAALAPKAVEFFRADESAANVLDRVALLRQAMPEHPWPTFDAADLTELLTDACRGKRGIEDARKSTLSPLLLSRLPYPLDRLLAHEAPETIEVPSGSHIRITYSPTSPPVLAVRLQELFGWTDTPKLASGRVPVLLHLLGPNYRPVQITDDLRSFWSTTYFQVRKDLRTRYPRHSWPENPLDAKPEAKGRRRG